MLVCRKQSPEMEIPCHSRGKVGHQGFASTGRRGQNEQYVHTSGSISLMSVSVTMFPRREFGESSPIRLVGQDCTLRTEMPTAVQIDSNHSRTENLSSLSKHAHYLKHRTELCE